MSQKKQEQTFELSVKRLEQIADILSRGECELDEALKLYDEGVKLADFCNKKLDSVKQKITFVEPADGEADDE